MAARDTVVVEPHIAARVASDDVVADCERIGLLLPREPAAHVSTARPDRRLEIGGVAAERIADAVRGFDDARRSRFGAWRLAALAGQDGGVRGDGRRAE